jgi:dihydrofolate reductase
VPQRQIIVNIATSADGYVARPDGNLDWLTERPAPKGFYGLPKFERSSDAKILGRKTFDRSLQLGARFHAGRVHYVRGSLGQPARRRPRLPRRSCRRVSDFQVQPRLVAEHF